MRRIGNGGLPGLMIENSCHRNTVADMRAIQTFGTREDTVVPIVARGQRVLLQAIHLTLAGFKTKKGRIGNTDIDHRNHGGEQVLLYRGVKVQRKLFMRVS